jgi:serine/threonine protein kinase
MSPEQAEGKPVDARSDLVSMGVMLYEMSTGQRPFTGDTSISIISSIGVSGSSLVQTSCSHRVANHAAQYAACEHVRREM